MLGRRDGVGVPGAAVDERVRRSEYIVRRRYFRHAKKNENLFAVRISAGEVEICATTYLANVSKAVSTPIAVDIL